MGQSVGSVGIEAQDLLGLMQQRRSLRRYEARAVPPEWIGQLLEAARWAPSAHNRQPWRFVIIEGPATKKKLAQEMGARLRRDLEADQVPPAVIEADIRRSHQRITAAPLLIAVCMTLADMDVYADARRNAHERTMAVQSTAMAGQNILLMAAGLGLGSCWMCAPLFCPQLVQEVLQLPADWVAQGLIAIGFPAQKREKTRAELETRVLWR